MSENFYRAFEDKHRGSRDLIKSRQRIYLPFILPLQSIYSDAKAIDLGCGRGEWLELLTESGFDALGVDLDDGMLAICRKLHLNVATTDALAALKTLPNESQLIVSGFHIAEHIPFIVLQILVQEAMRVLKPGGLLIFETPNPENIVVGSCNFYLDPTHQRPIPPQLLGFLPEHYGFARIKILRLHEALDLSGSLALTLGDVLGGASPDYAVVAQKAANENILSATSQAFEPEYGITLEALADKYDRQTNISALNFKIMEAEAKAQLAEAKAQLAEAKLQTLLDSTSWKITGLLRVVGNMTKSFFKKTKSIKSIINNKLRLLLLHTMLYFTQRPKVKSLIITTLGRFPTVKRWLMQVSNNEFFVVINQPSASALENLTPRALRIYNDIKNVIGRNKNEKS